MSRSAITRLRRQSTVAAPLFAALGDSTRLGLIAKLSDGAPRSIASLCEGEVLTRQAISKHLRVLEDVALVCSARHGRESLYTLDPRPIDSARAYIDLVSAQWDGRLERLKALVEG